MSTHRVRRPCSPPPPRPARGRHRSLRARALAHTGRASPAAPTALAALVALLLGACGGDVAGGTPAGLDPRAEVAELVELCTPLDPTLTSDHHDRQLHARRAKVAALERAGRAVGLEALRVYRAHSSPEEPFFVRLYTLEVAAHAAREETRPLLEELISEYGYPLDVRTEAVRLLAETSPERAIEVIGPLVKKTRRTQTLPDDEFLVRGYVTACTGARRSPVDVLVDVATNIYKQEAARHYAAEALGGYPDEPIGIKALETILVESTGNTYLRIKAAQSLRKALPAETACELFRRVAEYEAGANFLQFLADMLDELGCE